MNPANFLFASLDEPLIGDLAWQIEREGHDVKWFIASGTEGEIGDGFVPKIDDWRAELDWADVVVFDDVWIDGEIGVGEIARRLRADGHAVVGGTPLTDRLEDDRGFAMETLEAHGVDVLPHREFTDFEAGIAFVEERPAPYVIKPLGEVQNVKRLLYVGREDDGGDVIDVLRAYERAWGHRMKGFQLQRRVEGVEIAICGFFDGRSFVEPVNFNFEHKKLFPGNVGPSTGEMGTSMFWSRRNHLFERTLGRVEGLLAEEGYVGSVDLNCIVNADGVFPLEFTPRFGYPTIAIQQEGFESPTGEFFYELAHGRSPDLRVHRGFQVGVRICVPPFPFDDEATFRENSRNAAIVFKTDDRVPSSESIETVSGDPPAGVHLEDTKNVDGQWRVAGTSGLVLVVTGTGETMGEARAQCYERLGSVVIPNMYYRDDIGERWIRGEGDRLHAWGYLGPT